MVTLCWAAKGGSGTTVVAATLALTCQRPSLLVDLAGEAPAVLGLPEPDRPGVAEWLVTDTPADHLVDLLIEIGTDVWLLPWSSTASASSTPAIDPASPRWAELGAWLISWSSEDRAAVTIDAGTGTPPPAMLGCADRALLVTRPCYLALRRAVRCSSRPTGVVVVTEPGRALTIRDIEHALGAPVTATVSIDPLVARAVDAGLLSTRLPRVITRELRRIAA
jgi:MinD superfamily P-loop ATPase